MYGEFFDRMTTRQDENMVFGFFFHLDLLQGNIFWPWTWPPRLTFQMQMLYLRWWQGFRSMDCNGDDKSQTTYRTEQTPFSFPLLSWNKMAIGDSKWSRPGNGSVIAVCAHWRISVTFEWSVLKLHSNYCELMAWCLHVSFVAFD